jgi:hypothetical protein
LNPKTALKIVIPIILAVIILTSLFFFTPSTAKPSFYVYFNFQNPYVTTSSGAINQDSLVYQNAVTIDNFTACVNTTSLLYQINVLNTGKVSIHNATVYFDGASEPLMLGYIDNNSEFVPFNASFFPVAFYWGTVDPLNQNNYGNNTLINVQTPNQTGQYQIQCRFESKEVSFPFNLTVNVVAKNSQNSS